MAEQFIKFNRNFLIKTYELNRVDRPKDIRNIIIKGFINLSNYFTDGAFAKSINNQTITHNIIFGQYRESEDIKKAINFLVKNQNNNISFDKINSFLFFFHKNGQFFSFITNKSSDDDECQKILELKNLQINKENEKLKNFKNYLEYSQDEFLNELKNILDINNPIKSEERNSKLKSISFSQNYLE